MLVPYFLSLVGAICNEAFFPHFHLFTFAPFLALLVIRKNLLPALWISALGGLSVDLFSTHLHFGLYASAFVITTLVIFRLGAYFFEEKPHALALFSLLAALVFTLVESFLHSLFGSLPPFSSKALFTNLLVMPLCDGLFSFFWFSLPLKLYTYIKKNKFKRIFS